MNIFGSFMDIFDQKNKTFMSKNTKIFMSKKNKDIFDPQRNP